LEAVEATGARPHLTATATARATHSTRSTRSTRSSARSARSSAGDAVFRHRQQAREPRRQRTDAVAADVEKPQPPQLQHRFGERRQDVIPEVEHLQRAGQQP
jgi:hypothetical protein